MENREEKKTIWITVIKVFLVILFLFGIVPFVFINGGIRFSNWIFHITGYNLSASGLLNQDWFSFWGTFLGGVATVFAVWWTVYQTEKHYLQTSDEQKRQNLQLAEEQKKQRKLDVLPLILLQPIIVRQSSLMTILLKELEEKKKDKLINIDELKSVYEEFDISELTIVFPPKFEMRLAGLLEDEIRRIKNYGLESVSLDKGMKTESRESIIFSRPFWFVNAGREAAINIQIYLSLRDNNVPKHLPHVFSLMPKEKIKLNFLVDVPVDKEKSIFGEYQFTVKYSDLYANNYRQEYKINIFDGAEKGMGWTMNLGTEQIEEKE